MSGISRFLAKRSQHGLEARWIVKHQRPDRVLVDLTVPRLGGFETIRQIRKFDPDIRGVTEVNGASSSMWNLALGCAREAIELWSDQIDFGPAGS